MFFSSFFSFFSSFLVFFSFFFAKGKHISNFKASLFKVCFFKDGGEIGPFKFTPKLSKSELKGRLIVQSSIVSSLRKVFTKNKQAWLSCE